jgi:hypothetical protein
MQSKHGASELSNNGKIRVVLRNSPGLHSRIDLTLAPPPWRDSAVQNIPAIYLPDTP